MSHNHEVAHAQVEHAELDSGANAVEVAAGLVGRNQVGDVADDEQLSRHGAENRLRVDAAVRAGDHHDLRILTEGRQLFVVVGVRDEVTVTEAAVANGEVVWEAAHGLSHKSGGGG
jgi:hypothetical protein